ncbi:GDP-D-glucose phosphorylase 1-like [Acanthaster planci]|uniref:GDP-D-glucose phosphorylase 1 n=1 Tax=Acanthaster planci TaxID=133434 RepID=A0A8B7YQX7_ACAPL|nr:GDP-D-glucose phosphorylase 1-like [Acanthaster planci]XP_022095683.1 GDP-D-glucose phosphorylase 1-like [Acanthaster planci]XP_022095684.1 GDP-D-glucose phosphorylase 1-like [Acanthaster planci]
MEQFEYSDQDFLFQIPQPSDVGKVELSEFDKLLCSKWDAAVDMGYFRYKLDKLQTKIVPGPRKIVAQLNTKRAVERRKPQTITHVTQPFNPDIFNFTKVDPKEVLFELCPEKENPDSTTDDQSLCNGTAESRHHSVLINVSPLEYCNILLVPSRFRCIPQVLTEDAMHLALETMLLSAHSGFILGFNSLCALASVNHQHFHGYYLEHDLPIRRTATRQVIGPCYELADWPVRGFVFQVRGHTLQETARSVQRVASILQQNEIAHNVFITRGCALGDESITMEQTVRIVLWPRKSYLGAKTDKAGASIGFNVAVCELAGHLPVYTKEYFNEVTEEGVVQCLQKASLSSEEFEELKHRVRSVFQK